MSLSVKTLIFWAASAPTCDHKASVSSCYQHANPWFCLANFDGLLLLRQATAEQIRLAQMISDHNDADFEEKVKQVRIYLETCCYSSYANFFSYCKTLVSVVPSKIRYNVIYIPVVVLGVFLRHNQLMMTVM